MALNFSSLSGGTSFTVIASTGGSKTATLDKSYPAGTYLIESKAGDTNLEVYLGTAAGASAGSAAAGAKSITATSSFLYVTTVNADANDAIVFTLKSTATLTTKTDAYWAPPTITDITPSGLPNLNDTTTITGTNFATNVDVKFRKSDDATLVNAKTTVRGSATSIIAGRPDTFSPTDAPYDVIVTNPSTGLAATSLNSITAGAVPVWVTSTTLNAATLTQAFSQTIQATDSDGGSSITYAIVSGALQTGLSLNTSTGVISGTPTGSEGNTTVTISATDSGGNAVNRTFTQAINPNAIVVDYLVIAGGGGSGRTGGGGGAGGLRSLSSQQLPAGTSYTVLVGAGGAGGIDDNRFAYNGGNSSFNSLVATGGGGGASYNNSGANNGQSGGSGSGGGTSDGGSTSRNGGSGNAGGYTPVEGYAGGNGALSRGGGGGGGASQAGANGTTSNGGVGGNGSSTYSSWGAATSTGENVSGTYYYAGGGGGSSGGATNKSAEGGLGGGGGVNSVATTGDANTGGGAGSPNDLNGYAGGSGIVIVRYAGAQVAYGGNNVVTTGGYTYHVFTASGTFSTTQFSGTAKATGGIITKTSTHWIHTFNQNGSFVPSQNLTNVDYLVVAGGGAGGGYNGAGGSGASGGGGGGGVRCTVDNTGRLATLPSKINLNSGTTYTVTVGGGGSTGNGVNSSISGSGLSTITSIGGGVGGTRGVSNASSGGSGGGGYGDGSSNAGAAGTTDEGFSGGNGSGVDGGSAGGGGGAGQIGETGYRGGASGTWYAGDGGNGIQTSITGVSNYYGGGGGGGSGDYGGGWLATPNGAGAGGLGGGGRGAQAHASGTNANGQNAQSGQPNTGGGGGGRDNSNYSYGQPGGSGIVIISYPV